MSRLHLDREKKHSTLCTHLPIGFTAGGVIFPVRESGGEKFAPGSPRALFVLERN
jgi:hypothetical protein